MKTSDQVGSYGSGHLVSKPKPDSSGFLSMLDPGLANTVRHRLPRQIRSMDSTSQTLPVTEAEWSFDEPLAKVLGQVIKEALPRADIKRKGEIKIAEYVPRPDSRTELTVPLQIWMCERYTSRGSQRARPLLSNRVRHPERRPSHLSRPSMRQHDRHPRPPDSDTNQ